MTFLDLDVTSDDSVTEVVGQVIARFGRLDVLANNAGVGTNGAAEEVSVAQVREHGVRVLRVQRGPPSSPR